MYTNDYDEVGNDAETDGKIINVSPSRARQDSRDWRSRLEILLNYIRLALRRP